MSKYKIYIIWAAALLVVVLIVRRLSVSIGQGGPVVPSNGGMLPTINTFKCNPSAADRDKMIGIGTTKSNEVCYLQTWLNTWFKSGLKVDGNFGNKTLSALQSAKPGTNSITFSLKSIGAL